MKRSIMIMGVAFFCLTATAQETPPTTPTTPAPTTSTWDYTKNPTVDSINAKYRDKLVAAPAALTVLDIFPVIGKYESTTNPEAAVITITLDEQNKGIAWIDGLPQGRIKALLRKSPATYKVPAQKTEEGKEVAEGTLIFDKELNSLSIVIGKPYDEVNPASVFMTPVVTEEEAVTAKTSKSKKKEKESVKPWIYTGSKVVKTTALSNTAVNATAMNTDLR